VINVLGTIPKVLFLKADWRLWCQNEVWMLERHTGFYRSRSILRNTHSYCVLLRIGVIHAWRGGDWTQRSRLAWAGCRDSCHFLHFVLSPITIICHLGKECVESNFTFSDKLSSRNETILALFRWELKCYVGRKLYYGNSFVAYWKLVFLITLIRFITHKRGPTCEPCWDGVMCIQIGNQRCIYASPPSWCEMGNGRDSSGAYDTEDVVSRQIQSESDSQNTLAWVSSWSALFFHMIGINWTFFVVAALILKSLQKSYVL
jgi:hypothetical protein